MQKKTRLRRWHILIVLVVWLGWLTVIGVGLAARCYENGGFETLEERAVACENFFKWYAPMRGIWPPDSRGLLEMWLIWTAMAIGAAAFILVRTHRRPKK